MSDASRHIPVLLDESIQHLSPPPGGIVVDGTLGGGGHAAALLSRIGPSGRVIALDRDPQAVERGRHRFEGQPVVCIQENFRQIDRVLSELGIASVDCVLLDLGFSTDQMSDPLRGFSFQAEGPLDMRMDPTDGPPAWELIAYLREKDLADLIYTHGEERFARRIAAAIVQHRRREPIKTTTALADIVSRSLPRSVRSERHRLHPATRTFQALRIAVNEELASLAEFLDKLPRILRQGGRAGIISFHSLEDRMVKHVFKDRDRFERITPKPLRPSESEVRLNPRARSARLRVAELR